MVLARRYSVLVCFFAFACASDEAPREGEGLVVVGPSGGRVDLDTFTLEIPEGALTVETELRVSEVATLEDYSFEGTPRSRFYRVEPAGLRFARPAVVRIEFSGADEVQVVWSDAAESSRLTPLTTVVDVGVAVANVDHLSVGGVVEPGTGASDAGPRDADAVDAGAMDAAPTDGGPGDTGPADLGPTEDSGPQDTGVADSGPDDTGPTDTGPADTGPTDTGPADTGPADTGPADTGPADTGPADTGPADAGFVDSGVAPEIVPSTLNPPDACLTRTTTVALLGGMATSWNVLTPTELSNRGFTAYAGATFDPATRVITFAPTNTLSGYMRAFGLRAVLVGGGDVERVWSFAAPGLGGYVVSQGGPPIFTASAVPDVSRASAASYAVSLAAPASAHPCSGVSYFIDPMSCGAVQSGLPFMVLDGSGQLTVDALSLVNYSDGAYCVRVHAQQAGSQVYFHSRDYTFQVAP